MKDLQGDAHDVGHDAEGDADSLSHRPFAWHETADGRVRISYEGRVVTIPKDGAAARFRRRVEGADDRSQQLAMARATGNFRRGNEREGKARERGA